MRPGLSHLDGFAVVGLADRSGARLDNIPLRSPVPSWRSVVQTGVMVIVGALVLGRGTARSLVAREMSRVVDSPESVTTKSDQAVFHSSHGVARLEHGRTLRSGKRFRAFPVAVGCDDPDDDETSDDPADDGDVWEELDPFSETEAQVFVCYQVVSCHDQDLGTESQPLWTEPLHFISLLKLQRLRC
jgi:hypothetical protein